MLDPHTSVIMRSQDAFLRFLLGFEAATPEWSLLREIGADFDGSAERHFARRQLIGYSCGLFQYFEFFWSQHPWLISLIGRRSTPVHMRIQLASDFIACCFDCLSRGCQRIRNLFPSVGLLLMYGYVLFSPFLNHACIANDFCERLNAKIRSLVARTSGQACNFTVASNRAFTHAMNTLHVGRGGLDTRTKGAVEASATAQLIKRLANSSQRGGIGGSAALEYGNLRRSVLTDVAKTQASDDPHSAQVDMEAIDARIKDEWAGIIQNPEDYNDWLRYFRSKRKKVVSSTDAEAIVDGAASASCASGALPPTGRERADIGPTSGQQQAWSTGVWGSSGSRHQLLDPSVMAACTASFDKLDKDTKVQEIREDPDVEVRGGQMPEPPGCPKDRRRGLHGCGAMSRNICTDHCLTRCQAIRLNEVVNLLSQYVTMLGKEQARSLQELVALVGRDSEEDTRLIVFTYLLCDPRYRPVMQFYIPVIWDFHGAPADPSTWSWPQNGILQYGIPRMERLDTALESITFYTSDEVSLDAINSKLHWSIHPVNFEWLPGPNLLRLRLLGLGPLFVPPPPKPKKHVASYEFMDDVDPWAVGEAAARGSVAPLVDTDAADSASSDSVLDGLEPHLADSDVDLAGIGEHYDGDISDGLDCPPEGVAHMCEGGDFEDVEVAVLGDVQASAAAASDPPLPPPPAEPPAPQAADVSEAPLAEEAVPREVIDAPVVVAAPGENTVLIDGETFSMIRRKGALIG